MPVTQARKDTNNVLMKIGSIVRAREKVRIIKCRASVLLYFEIENLKLNIYIFFRYHFPHFLQTTGF